MAERLDSPLRREQIAEAALAIIVEQGLGAVTVRRVAQAVGISAAALYRHYANKGDILAAVLEEHHELFMASVGQAKAECSTPLARLRHLYCNVMKLVERYRALPVVFLSDVVRFDEKPLRELRRKHQRSLRETVTKMLVEGQEQGEIRSDIGAEELYVHFVGLIVMPALMHARNPEEVDINRQTEAGWRLFAQAVAV